MDAQSATNSLNAQFILLLLTALGALATAIFTAFAANAAKKAARGSALLSCLDKYVSIRKDRREAIERKSLPMAEEYYREILDLHWSEYHLWQQGVIPDGVMFSWLQIRKRNFENEAIEFETDTKDKVSVTYQSQWQKLKTQNYFEQSDSFVRFMEKAHKGEIIKLNDLKKVRKEL